MTEFSGDVLLQLKNLKETYYRECNFANGDFRETGDLGLLQLTNNYFGQTPISLSINATKLNSLIFTKNKIKMESLALNNPTNLEFITLTDVIEIPNITKDLLKNSTKLIEVIMSSNNLKSVESIGLPDSVKYLDLSQNNITRLTNSSFWTRSTVESPAIETTALNRTFSHGPNKLEKIYLTENPIAEIESHTFENLNSLENLDLSHGKLKTIDMSAFVFTPNLEYLNLSNNQIECLVNTKQHFNRPIEPMTNTDSDIIVIRLDYFWEQRALDLIKNQLTKIESNIFENFRNIVSVILSNNPIKSIHKRSFIGMDSLRNLQLDHCKIESIDFTTFSILPKLKVLNLSFNRLNRIDYSIIPLPIFTMNELLLNNNQLTSFPFKKSNLPNISELRFENNNVTCNYLSKEIRSFCHD